MKAVYDTCLYIDFLREGKWSEIFQNRFHIRFLSPVVLLELNAGVNTISQKKVLDRLFYPYSKAQRIIGIDTNHFYKAGEILSHCRRKIGMPSKGFSHDVLIAVSAFSVGATLFTRDRGFEFIKPYLRLNLQIL